MPAGGGVAAACSDMVEVRAARTLLQTPFAIIKNSVECGVWGSIPRSPVIISPTWSFVVYSFPAIKPKYCHRP